MMRLLTLLLLMTWGHDGITQEKFELFFKDNCVDSIIQLDFSADDLNNNIVKSDSSKILLPKKGFYFITTGLELSTNKSQLFFFLHNFQTPVDTVSLANIRFTGGSALHSREWNYNYCKEICEGTEIDYWDNGNKRIEGFFENGKPTYMYYYNKNGNPEKAEYYVEGKLQLKLIEHFDQNGELEIYEEIKERKRKTIRKSFDKNDNLISKEITKHNKS